MVRANPPDMVNGLFVLVCTSSTLGKDHRGWRGTVVRQGGAPLMRVFGTKQVEPTDEDRAAAARLSAVAARFKTEPTTDFTETSPDPIGEPEESPEVSETDVDEAEEPDGEE